MIHTSFSQSKGVVFAGVVFALVLAACCPYPHYEREAPVFEGTITRQGAAAPNVRVTLSTARALPPGCANPKVEARTDANGKFHIDPPKYFEPGISIGDRRDAWSLCFIFADGLEAGWNGEGYWGGSGFQILDCQIGESKPSGKTLLLGNISANPNLENGCRVQTFTTVEYTKTREALPKPTK